MGVEPAVIDRVLLGLEQGLQPPPPPRTAPGAPSPEELRQVEQVATQAGSTVRELVRESLPDLIHNRRIQEARRQAAEIWKERLKPLSPRQRRLLVTRVRRYQVWAVAEALCHASEEAASDRADRALELAELAVLVAQLAPGDELWRKRLLGYCLGFLANAKRVANDGPGAEAAFVRARELWQAGAPADPGILAEWRLLDREASLHRDQRRFAQSLELFDRALAVAPRSAAGRVLINKAVALEHMGEAALAIAALREAAPLIDEGREPRQIFGLRFNLSVNLCHLDRFAEAEALLPEVRRLAVSLRNQLDLVRVVWLGGKVAAGFGRTVEALAAFEQVRRKFQALRMAYDYALVTLELSVLLLTLGRRLEVQEIAREMVWIFEAEGIHREALAALALFRDAALGEQLTAELAPRLIRYLYRARHSAELRFEP